MDVGLVQVNMEPAWSASALDGASRRYALLPYSVGLLQAYATRHGELAAELRFREPVFGRLPVDEAVSALVGCDVAGFSSYVWNEIREPHAPIDGGDEVPEYIDVVIATASMPREDWVRAKTFAWLADTLYFDRLLQMPFLLLGSEAGVPLRALVELFTDADAAAAPVVAGPADELRANARAIQQGGLEWFPDADAGILWPADQHVLVRLVRDGLLDRFYGEAATLLSAFLALRGLEEHELVVDDALSVNRALFNVPGDGEDVEAVVWHTVWERYLAVIHGSESPLAQKLTRYVADGSTYASSTTHDWYRRLVWCDWKDKRAYLRPLRPRPRGAESFAANA